MACPVDITGNSSANNILKQVRALEEFKVVSDINKTTLLNIETLLNLEEEKHKHLESLVSKIINKVSCQCTGTYWV